MENIIQEEMSQQEFQFYYRTEKILKLCALKQVSRIVVKIVSEFYSAF